ncbi:MAG: HigA family addiction module antidote protein [Chloroflexi bacterium]|nr:HigA family addiction module antidote protein [Chloroflexota bacterium]
MPMTWKSPTTTDTSLDSEEKIYPPIYPGEHLLEDFMKPLGLSANRLAIELRIPATRILAIIHGKRSITGDTALRLGRYFGTSARFWMNLQAHYDLEVAEDDAGKKIERDVIPRPDIPGPPTLSVSGELEWARAYFQRGRLDQLSAEHMSAAAWNLLNEVARFRYETYGLDFQGALESMSRKDIQPIIDEAIERAQRAEVHGTEGSVAG